jgi:hypothetical protein
MEDFTHAYCATCDAIRTVTRESLTGPDTSVIFVGGDLLCKRCGFVVATLYKAKGGAPAVDPAVDKRTPRQD